MIATPNRRPHAPDDRSTPDGADRVDGSGGSGTPDGSDGSDRRATARRSGGDRPFGAGPVGAVLTATELEGIAPAADWSRWERTGAVPRSGDGAGFAANAADDLAQLRGLGLDEVAMTLEWARLEPRDGHWDEAAAEAVDEQLRTARAAGLRVWACLVDGTLPGWFADDLGGFGDDRARGLRWPRHVDTVGERFGDRVDGWIPQRESAHWALRRLAGPAGRPETVPAAEGATAVRDALLADGEAWRLLRGTRPVATMVTVRPVVGDGGDVKAARRARFVTGLLTDTWVGALERGVVAAPGTAELETPHLRDAFDRVVAMMRPPIRVDAGGRWRPEPAERPVAPTGLLTHPEMELDALHEVLGRVTRPSVAAADLASVIDDGRNRPDQLRTLLDGAADLASTTSLEGWWQASPIDGYAWEWGFRVRPGVIDRSRTPSAAAAELSRTARGDAG
ncbi:MAG: hypothetical protein ACK5PP_03720 [Acidimicrobiales bacterium]